MENTVKTGIFSGRFDPPHVGHVITVNRILKCVDYVWIVILDYRERFVVAKQSLQIFNDVFMYNNHVFYVINNIHFGKITQEELEQLIHTISPTLSINDCVYFGGNEQVNEHIKSLKCIQVIEMPRSWEYASSEIKEEVCNRCKAKQL